VYGRLLAQRIVMASGKLDGEAAARLCAQLLTLDAEGDGPIRLEMQGLDAELPAALTVMGVLEVLRAPVYAQAGGRISGPALGILASAGHRRAYPSALFALTEPRVSIDGTATSLASQEQQFRAMLDQLYTRLAETTGRRADEIRADARRERLLTVEDALAWGLIEARAGAL
jgi:ATP-dependent Clp protease protease subunit